MNLDFTYVGPTSGDRSVYFNLYDRTSGEVAIDIETISLDNRDPLGIGFSPNPQESFYFPIDSDLLPWHILQNPAITKIIHNGHYDLEVLKTYFDLDIPHIYDTLIAAHLQGLPPALNALAKHLFGVDLFSIEDLLGKKGKNQATMDQVPYEKVAQKCCNDTMYSFKAWETLKSHLPWEAFQLEMDVMPVLMRMQQMGMRIDVERLLEHKVQVEKDVVFYKMIAQGMGFNPGSSLQVAAVLQSRGWDIRYKRGTGKPIMNEEELSTTYKDDPLSHLVLAYRKANVLKSTFIDAVLEKHLDGDRIYPNVNQAVVVSGRLSRTKPNTQNIPFSMRDIFIPSEGNEFEDWDLSQIELRILAYNVWQATGDYTMQAVYDRDGNIHQETTNAINQLTGLSIEYKVGKEINFASVYRGTPHTLYQKMGIPEHLGKIFQDAFKTSYPGVEIYFQQVCQQIARDGYSETAAGRRRYLPDIESSFEWQRRKAEREGFNHVIQGTAAEVMKRLQVKTGHGPQCNQIHDEIIFDMPQGFSMNKEACLNLASFRTPMEIKRGPNWKQLKEVGKYG